MKKRWQQRVIMSVLTFLIVGGILVIPQETTQASQSEQSVEERRPPPPPPRANRPRRPPRDNNNEENTTSTLAALLGQLFPSEEVTTSEASVETTVTGRSELATTDVNILALVALADQAAAEHVDQQTLLTLLENGELALAFEEAFEMGDELFETRFNALDGVGANVGQNFRFTQIPRADLTGEDEWANHFPTRITGPNAEACNECHGAPFDDGAGRAANNNVRDPLHSGDMALFIQRNTPHVFGAGAVQVLAEEMTEALHVQRDETVAAACASGEATTATLHAKGVSFGELTVQPTTTTPCTVVVDATNIVGIDADLVVRPFQWKGVIPTIRAFNRDAAHQELGMQSIEIVGEGIDGDGDGVVDELTVGDQTALAIYLAAQPRPTTLLELAELGLIDPLSAAEEAAIMQGEALFERIGCTACHAAEMAIDDPIFYEPSQNPHYRDETFPAGQDPVANGLDPAFPVAFDLTQDQPDNHVETAAGIYHLGAFASHEQGGALVALYGDMKRHDMGPALAESIDDEGIPASVFLTENLWGVGSTAPYLHDGRATTLTEAILLHGGEAQASRDGYVGLEAADQSAIIAFLNNLVLYKMAKE